MRSRFVGWGFRFIHYTLHSADVSRAPSAFAGRQLLAPLAVALLLRLSLVALVPVMPAWDGVIYDRAGQQLAEGRGYTQQAIDPSMPTTPTAFFPVGLPAVLAALRKVGFGPGGMLAVQAIAGALLVPVAWVLGRRLGGRRGGRWAAWLVALWPGGVLLSISYLAEPLSALGIALAMVPLALARRRRLPFASVISAVVLGLTAYLRATPLAIAPCVFLLVGLAFLGSRKKKIVGASLFAALSALVAVGPLVPWAVRNARVMHAPVLVSTNGGFNLLMGTTGEGGYGESIAGIDCPSGMREVDVDACRRDHALVRIARDPVAWLARGTLKLSHTFGYESAPAQYFSYAQPLPQSGASWERKSTLALAACRVFWVPFLVLAALGLAYAIRDARRRLTVGHAITLGPLLGFSLLHFVYIGGDRYHAAVVPMMAALAGLAVARARRR